MSVNVTYLFKVIYDIHSRNQVLVVFQLQRLWVDSLAYCTRMRLLENQFVLLRG